MKKLLVIMLLAMVGLPSYGCTALTALKVASQVVALGGVSVRQVGIQNVLPGGARQYCQTGSSSKCRHQGCQPSRGGKCYRDDRKSFGQPHPIIRS